MKLRINNLNVGFFFNLFSRSRSYCHENVISITDSTGCIKDFHLQELYYGTDTATYYVEKGVIKFISLLPNAESEIATSYTEILEASYVYKDSTCATTNTITITKLSPFLVYARIKGPFAKAKPKYHL